MNKKEKEAEAFDVMAKAIIKYVEAMGGTALVVGGVSIGQEPGALKYNYFIQVNITGKKPTKKNL